MVELDNVADKKTTLQLEHGAPTEMELSSCAFEVLFVMRSIV